MKPALTFLTALLLVPLAALHGAARPEPDSKPNILILLADDLGNGDLRNDQVETNNLYLKHPEVVVRWEAEMQRIKAGTQIRP